MPTAEQLPERVKREIVQRLAEWETPTEVARAIKAAHKIDLTQSLQRIQYYDPTKSAGRALAADLRALFHETRAKSLENLESIRIFHKAHQLRALDRQLVKAESNAGASVTAIAIIEAAAKISGTLAPAKQEHKHEGAIPVTPVINLYGRPGSDAAPQAVDGVRKPGD
jgi:hypothetical protein